MAIRNKKLATFIALVLIVLFVIGISNRRFKIIRLNRLQDKSQRTLIKGKVISCEKGWRTSVLNIKYRFEVGGVEYIDSRLFDEKYENDFLKCVLNKPVKVIYYNSNPEFSYPLISESDYKKMHVLISESICR